MKEKGFGRDTEHAATQSPGTSRGASVNKPHRPTKTEKLDVDALVTDFLQSLDTYSDEDEAPPTLGPETPALVDPVAEAPIREVLMKSSPPIGPEVVPSEAKILHADVDAELDQTLREIEARPKLSVIPSPAREIVKTPPPAPSTLEAVSVSEAPAPLPAHPAEISVAKAETPVETVPAGKVRPFAEPKIKAEQGFENLPEIATPPSSTPGRRLVTGIAALGVTGAICLAIYLFYPGRPTPTGNGPATDSQSASTVPDTIGAQPGAAKAQAPQNALPLKEVTRQAGGTQPDPAQAARAAATQPAVKTAVPGTRNDNLRPNIAPPPNVPAPAKGLETNAPAPAKPAPPPRNEAQVENNAVVSPPAQPPPTPTTTAGAKPTEPPTGGGAVQAPIVPVTPAKGNAEPPPVEAPKVAPPAPPTGGDAATTNPPAAADLKPNAPAAKTGFAPIATPAEPISKVTPAYPLAAQKMKAYRHRGGTSLDR